MESKFDAYNAILESFEIENRRRTIPADRTASQSIDLSENDYLGLGKRYKEFLKDFYRKYESSFSSSASRLLAGNQIPYQELENLLMELYVRPALLFNSGYHANVGTLSA
ncbi:MAG: 8-amino-7-oxononanoate synthase, partial [Muribaculaceae bacterium]|nr:8-amino-7-oxononanoate synthase [Muribaculaceae bacterium]